MKPSVLLVSLGSGLPAKSFESSFAGDGTFVKGVAANAAIVGDGGTPPYTYYVSAGSEPPGMVLEADGTLSGTPTAQGYFEFLVAVNDSGGSPEYETWYTIEVAGGVRIDNDVMPYACNGNAYSADLRASGGTLPYTWTLQDGELPDGLSIVESGGRWTVEGTATLPDDDITPQRYDATLRVTDDAGDHADKVVPIFVWQTLELRHFPHEPVVSLWQGVPFEHEYTVSWGPVSPGTPAYGLPLPLVRFRLVPDDSSNGVPDGLQIDPLTGLVSGLTQELGGLHVFDVVAEDQFGNTRALTQRYRLQTTYQPFFFEASVGNGVLTEFEVRTPFTERFHAQVVRNSDGYKYTGSEVSIVYLPRSSPDDPLFVMVTFNSSIPAADAASIVAIGT
ncbi:MAG TPA: putative Ig domain-containing protein [Tahibacter sp.]|nr:putative Ig domain-containing protein [Tahibacter sp.]